MRHTRCARAGPVTNQLGAKPAETWHVGADEFAQLCGTFCRGEFDAGLVEFEAEFVFDAPPSGAPCLIRFPCRPLCYPQVTGTTCGHGPW